MFKAIYMFNCTKMFKKHEDHHNINENNNNNNNENNNNNNNNNDNDNKMKRQIQDPHSNQYGDFCDIIQRPKAVN